MLSRLEDLLHCSGSGQAHNAGLSLDDCAEPAPDRCAQPDQAHHAGAGRVHLTGPAQTHNCGPTSAVSFP